MRFSGRIPAWQMPMQLRLHLKRAQKRAAMRKRWQRKRAIAERRKLELERWRELERRDAERAANFKRDERARRRQEREWRKIDERQSAIPDSYSWAKKQARAALTFAQPEIYIFGRPHKNGVPTFYVALKRERPTDYYAGMAGL